MIVIFIGPPGSGKSTQAKNVAKKIKVPFISMGQVLRDANKTGTLLGKKASKYIERGKLIPTKLIRTFIKFRLEEEDCKNGFILDGSPRRVEEAVLLDDYFEQKGWKLERIILIEISGEESLKRLLKRSRLPDDQGGGRNDDEIKDIKLRLKEYRDNIDIIKSYYRKQDKLCILNGEGTIEEVTKRVFSIMQL